RARSRSRTVSDGAAAGGASTEATVRQPTPMRPCRGGGDEEPDDDRQLVAPQAGQEVGERGDLGRPGPGGDDGLGRGHDFGQQRVGWHRSILPPSLAGGMPRAVAGGPEWRPACPSPETAGPWTSRR